jgi:hypothetical protein
MACMIHQSCTTHAGLPRKFGGRRKDFKSCTGRRGAGSKLEAMFTPPIRGDESSAIRALKEVFIGEMDSQIAACGSRLVWCLRSAPL